MTCECKGDPCFYQRHTKTNALFKKWGTIPAPMGPHLTHAPTTPQVTTLLMSRADKLWPDEDPGTCSKGCGNECKCRIDTPEVLTSTTGPKPENVVIDEFVGIDGCKWEFSGTVQLTTKTYKGTCGTSDDQAVVFRDEPSIDITISSKDLALLSSDFASKVKVLLERKETT